MIVMVTLAFPQAILACTGCSTSSFCCLPGFGLTGAHVGLALAIFAAILERPFISKAGVEHRTLWYSIQANLLSMISVGAVGCFVMGVTWRSSGEFFLLWFVAAVALNVIIERAWLQHQCGFVRVHWLIAGNILSSLVIMTLPMWRSFFGTDRYGYILGMRPYVLPITMTTVAVSVGVFVAAFVLARRLTDTNQTRGFDVLPVRPDNEGR